MIQPRPSTFWRFVFGILLLFALLAYRDLFAVAEQFGIVLTGNKTWICLFLLFTLFTLFLLGLLVLSFTKRADRLTDSFETSIAKNESHKALGGLLLVIGLAGFAMLSAIPYFVKVFGAGQAVHYLLFFLFAVVGTWGLRLLRKDLPWMTAFLAVVLFQSLIQLFLVYLPYVTAYPFAMGWSETSRFYFPSLFLSKLVYGREYPWPILHPTLHLLLAPPYLVDAPLWFHRFWQVAMRFLLIGLVVPPLIGRLSIQGRLLRWLVGLWMFLFLFLGPIYFHLTVPVILMLAGFSLHNQRRTWIVLLLVSIWCGWSRVNWYPVPGMLAAVLYFLEQPLEGKSIWKYLSRPALWFVTGTLVAFVSQRVYISLSGITERASFYSSFSSDLLWYRLLPSTTYPLGLLPAALLASLPMWLAIYLVLRSNPRGNWNAFRLALIGLALLVLFLGGLLVSLKIGGGADLHNLDAYFVLLLIVFSYLVFARYRLESGEFPGRVLLPWLLVFLILIVPAWTLIQSNVSFKTYNASAARTTLQSLQEKVDRVNAHGGSILFITQRHLISMHMLNGVTLVPEYEREDLMEMAMANNTAYLDRFKTDMQNQRFDLIVVDPLVFNLISRNRSFSEENNVWVRRVMRPILCNYRQDSIFPADEIALYVPQEGDRTCPALK
ncbi:MAG: hypothetical protein ACM3XO_06385 [Bacteroidota bacterium]